MTGRRRVGSMHRQVLLLALNLKLLPWLGLAALALLRLDQRRRAAAPAHAD
jgi:hypothetical protein